MYRGRKLWPLFVFLLVISVFVSAQTTSYEDFFGDFMKRKAEMVSRDGTQLGQLMDSWKNGNMSQSEVVAKVEELESRAEDYFTEILELRAPEGEFAKYKRSIYAFVTWYNIIGVFADGLTDMNMDKLDAASTLMDHFEMKVEMLEAGTN